jgi:hypothetical protein
MTHRINNPDSVGKFEMSEKASTARLRVKIKVKEKLFCWAQMRNMSERIWFKWWFLLWTEHITQIDRACSTNRVGNRIALEIFARASQATTSPKAKIRDIWHEQQGWAARLEAENQKKRPGNIENKTWSFGQASQVKCTLLVC